MGRLFFGTFVVGIVLWAVAFSFQEPEPEVICLTRNCALSYLVWPPDVAVEDRDKLQPVDVMTCYGSNGGGVDTLATSEIYKIYSNNPDLHCYKRGVVYR